MHQKTLLLCMSIAIPDKFSLKTHKLQFVWRDDIAKKILIDIFTNSQFRKSSTLRDQFLLKLNNLIKNEYNDDEIYKEMWKYIQNIPKSSKKLLNLNNHDFRTTNRAEKIQQLIKKYLSTTKFDKLNNIKKGISILDVGCADGNITITVGDYLDLHPSQINGCDITNLSEDHPNNDKFIFKHLNQNIEPKLPYENDSQDVVLALMSLHHIKSVELMICEIYRVLKPGGLLIIREHDSVGVKFPTILDVVHGFYGMVWSNPKEFDTFDDYYARYFSNDELKAIMEKNKFKEVYNDCRVENYPQFHRNKVINPLKYYYAAFKK